MRWEQARRKCAENAPSALSGRWLAAMEANRPRWALVATAAAAPAATIGPRA
eukprot:CAMPEP_0171141714 /NCGR_PEP_ID=MMETSP0766_2-20121228/141117_1 /TAXON_ID=439317 /ORGANISM="Gambierdiscus australes, Strain CAWD 149" /LENGTH=51 /DNA_ID=CAMNT_0011605453 /DNA_START=35 /DNA_END=186 /DNA_ORIENTATION=+